VSACVLDVEITPQTGRPGDRVALKVRVSNPAAVSAMRVSIVGYGLEESLSPHGPDWGTETVVPYEAGPGQYELDIYAVDSVGNRLGSVRGAFTVVQ